MAATGVIEQAETLSLTSGINSPHGRPHARPLRLVSNGRKSGLIATGILGTEAQQP